MVSYFEHQSFIDSLGRLCSFSSCFSNKKTLLRIVFRTYFYDAVFLKSFCSNIATVPQFVLEALSLVEDVLIQDKDLFLQSIPFDQIKERLSQNGSLSVEEGHKKLHGVTIPLMPSSSLDVFQYA